MPLTPGAVLRVHEEDQVTLLIKQAQLLSRKTYVHQGIDLLAQQSSPLRKQSIDQQKKRSKDRNLFGNLTAKLAGSEKKTRYPL